MKFNIPSADTLTPCRRLFLESLIDETSPASKVTSNESVQPDTSASFVKPEKQRPSACMHATL
jgi:hypothetical protein